jgi:hypothetical protein
MLRDAFFPTSAVMAALLVLHLAIATATQTMPLRVEQARVAAAAREGDPADIVVTVHNTGAQVIEAWGVRGEVRYTNGVTRPIQVSTDTYETPSLPESSRPSVGSSKRLLVDGTATLTVSAPMVPLAAAADVTVYPTLAVFEDDTATGDEPSIESIFSLRRRNQRIWQLASETWKSGLAQGLNLEQAAAATVAAMEAGGDEVRRSTGLLNIRTTLASSDPSRFQQVQMEIESRLAAANRHAVRRR